ncbi:uncharacterized protein isoform X2 [Leptinotarsa decemlineata]|uniref:uncharacterized protein isoform X2 n=1 Tax=Leptinotarsa decemlineata TaxID=7539 RepID=UPI003D3092F6
MGSLLLLENYNFFCEISQQLQQWKFIQTNPENFCTRTDQYGDTLPDAAGGSISRMQMSYLECIFLFY